VKWILQAINGGIWVGSSKLVVFLSVLQYVFAGNFLTPEKVIEYVQCTYLQHFILISSVSQVFVGFSLYKNTMLSITEMFPSAIAKAAEVYVSTTRIQVRGMKSG